MNPSRVLVIGATGYIGNKLVKSNLENFLFEGTSTKVDSNFLHFNLLELENLDKLIIKKGDFICFTAAISSPDLCSNISENGLAWKINVVGTERFIDSCLQKGAKVIFFSTDVVYGDSTQKVDESSVATPFGNYAIMKRLIEIKFEKNDNFKSIRLSYVFSKNDKFTKYLKSCVLNKTQAEIFTSLNRSIIYIDDLIEGINNIIKNWDELNNIKIINFGGPETLSRKSITEMISQKALKNLSYRIISPPSDFFKYRPENIFMESQILSKLLGREKTTIEDAIIKEFL